MYSDTKNPIQDLSNQDVESLQKMGDSYYDDGNIEDAIRLFSKALEINHNLPEIHAKLGNLWYRQGKLDLAIYSYKKAVELKPELAGVYWNIGLMYYQKGRVDLAIACGQKAIALEPKWADTKGELANFLRCQPKLKEEIQMGLLRIAFNLNLAEAHSEWGNGFGQDYKLDEATIKSLAKASPVQDNLAEVHRKIVTGKEDKKFDTSAIKSHQKASYHIFDLTEGHRRVISLGQQGKLDEAIETYLRLVEMCQQQSRLDVAADCLQQAIAFKPDWAEAYFYLGTVLENQGDLDQAAIRYEQAINLQAAIQSQQALTIKPSLIEAYFKLGNLLLSQGKHKEALEICQRGTTVQALQKPNALNIGGGSHFVKLGWVNLEEVTSIFNPHPYHLSPSCVFPVESSSLDTVYTSHALEHIDNPTIFRVFSETYRVLKDNGRFIIKIPDFDRSLDYWRRRDESFFDYDAWNYGIFVPTWKNRKMVDCLDYRAACIFCCFWNDEYGDVYSGRVNLDSEGVYFGPPAMPVEFYQKLIANCTPSQISSVLRQVVLKTEKDIHWGHHNAWSRKELEALLRLTGFRVKTFDQETILKDCADIPDIGFGLRDYSTYCWAEKETNYLNPNNTLDNQGLSQQDFLGLMEDAVSFNSHSRSSNGLSSSSKLDESFEERVIVNLPNWAWSHYSLGNALLTQGRIEEAIQSYQQALLFMPDCAEAHFSLGNTFLQQGRLQEAIQSYQQAAVANPSLVEGHSRLMWDIWSKYVITSISGSEKVNPEFVELGFKQGLLPEADIANFIEVLEECPTINFYQDDFVPGYVYNYTLKPYEKEINAWNLYYKLEKQHLKRLIPILKMLAQPVTECIGTPWCVIQIRCWKSYKGAPEMILNSWHNDGFHPAIYKIMVYLTGASLEIGTTELALKDGSTLPIKGSSGTWLLFKNTELKHRGVSPITQDRITIEFTITHAIKHDFRPVCAGENANYPKLPWYSYEHLIELGAVGSE